MITAVQKSWRNGRQAMDGVAKAGSESGVDMTWTLTRSQGLVEATQEKSVWKDMWEAFVQHWNTARY